LKNIFTVILVLLAVGSGMAMMPETVVNDVMLTSTTKANLGSVVAAMIVLVSSMYALMYLHPESLRAWNIELVSSPLF
jgi:hypothetical protein